MRYRYLLAITLLCAATLRAADTLTIHADRPTTQVSPTLYGIFFEEIGRAGDGGLYAEMIQNRSFEDGDTPVGWTTMPMGNQADGAASIDRSKPLNDANPSALLLTVTQPHPRLLIYNEGFKGMSIRKGFRYRLSLFARRDATFDGDLSASLAAPEGELLAPAQKFTDLSEDWKRHVCEFVATETRADARLMLIPSSAGRIWLDMVSLVPVETFKNRDNGLRPDLAGMLLDLKPAYMRFPGGCWVEGETLDLAYRWKQTIGPLERRRNQYNLWKYHSNHGLGYHEYLQLCEDLGAVPLFVINCGMSHRGTVPLAQMNEYVQDALDAIEYANGSADTRWGAERAKNGHPAPFDLKFMEIGNENGGAAYDERYALFYDAIKAKHPEIKLIADHWQGRGPNSRPIEILDEHYYNSPEWFIRNANHYDKYDRSGPKIYVGEYAVTRGNVGSGNLRAAVGEAAFMTGLERNSDVVVLASYAPLFVNVHYKVWNPNAINFDASRAYGTPSYWVQQMFATNRADVILPVDVQSDSAPASLHGAIGVGTWETQAEFKDITVEHEGKTVFAADFSKGLGGFTSTTGDWRTHDGALRQTSNGRGAYAVAGDPAWTDYTFSCKAQKLSGDEGFLIRFHSTSASDFVMWNIGGWGNRRHAVQQAHGSPDAEIISAEVPGAIEARRWYDIRVEATGSQVKCFLDGKLIHDIDYPTSRPIYSVAGRAGDDIIVKVVNTAAEAREVNLSLAGASRIAPKAKLVELSGDKPEDENSLENPRKVAPKPGDIEAGASFKHSFPGNSVSVLRFSTTR